MQATFWRWHDFHADAACCLLGLATCTQAKAVEDAAASGGQVVLSEQAVHLLHMAAHAKTTLLLHMGEHTLEDVEAGTSTTLYQAQPYALACRCAPGRAGCLHEDRALHLVRALAVGCLFL